MITLKEAYEKIDEAVSPIEARKLPLIEAAGCVINRDIVSPVNVPDFRCPSMDGIAIRHSDLEGEGPWRLSIQTVIAAGDYKSQILLLKRAVKIMTGAPLPEGADTVIPIEEVEIGSTEVVIREKPAAGEYIRDIGDDIREKEELIQEGDLLDPIGIGILASIGLEEIEVIPRPKIAVISTGTEIVERGAALKRGQIYDSNRIMLRSLLKRDNLSTPLLNRLCRDDLSVLCETISECLDCCDLIITTGGVSVGDYDLIPEAISVLGGVLLFHKVAIKPGKPILAAKLGKSWFLGLSGNPVSVVAGYHLFGKRIISRLMGRVYSPRIVQAALGRDLIIRGERFSITGARLENSGESVIAYPARRQQSGRLSSLKGIDGFIMLEGGDRIISKGTKVNIELL